MLSEELKLKNLQATVDQAVLEPARWVDVCDRLADFIGGVGTVIASEDIDYQVPGLIVGSPDLEGLVATMLRDGWLSRNYRRRAIPLIKERGWATDLDIADERTFRTEPFYADLMASQKLGVFVGVGLVTTAHTFIAGIQRRVSAPPPDDALLQRIELARRIVSEGARASVAIGASKLESWQELARESSRPVFVLDHLGRVIDRNAASEALVAGVVDLSHQQLRLRDAHEDQQLARLIDAACELESSEPLPWPVFSKGPERDGGFMFEAIRLPKSLRYFHSRAAALLIVRPVQNRQSDLGEMLRQHSGLTAAELKVALALFEGQSPTEYALAAGLSTGTVRQQIKSVYRKTGTGRQNELSALIRRLSDSISN